MQNKKIFSILLMGLFISVGAAWFTKIAPINFPLAVFTVSCTVLVAATAFPQIAIGLSSSHISKNLIPEFYKNWKHWLFVFYQALIAIWAIITEHSKAMDNNPCFFSRFLLFLIIFDFFAGFLYLEEIRYLIASPRYMLDSYIKRLRRILKKRSEKSVKLFSTEINNIGRIGRYTTMCYEKTYILETIEAILEMVTDQKTPKALRFSSGEKETLQENILTERQFEAWKRLMDYISDACTIYNEEHSANEENTLKALEILRGAWDKITQWKRGDFDYAACIRAINKIAHFSIKKSFDTCVEKAVAILADITQNTISEKSALISSQMIASTITEIGISAVKAGKDHMLPIFLVHLICIFELLDRKEVIYLLDILDLMAITSESNKDALIDLQMILDSIEDSQINEAMKYADPQKTARIERFFKAVNAFTKPDETSSFIKKFGRFLKKS